MDLAGTDASGLFARARVELAPALNCVDNLEPVRHPAAYVAEVAAGALGVTVGVEGAKQRTVSNRRRRWREPL